MFIIAASRSRCCRMKEGFRGPHAAMISLDEV